MWLMSFRTLRHSNTSIHHSTGCPSISSCTSRNQFQDDDVNIKDSLNKMHLKKLKVIVPGVLDVSKSEILILPGQQQRNTVSNTYILVITHPISIQDGNYSGTEIYRLERSEIYPWPQVTTFSIVNFINVAKWLDYIEAVDICI